MLKTLTFLAWQVLAVQVLVLSLAFVVSNGSARAYAAGSNTRFKITQNTLDHLRREGLPDKLVASMKSMLNQVHMSKEVFHARLADLPVPPRAPLETDLILRYAAMNQLKIQADVFSSDQKTRESVFRGNVKGEIPRENIRFSTSKLRLLLGKENRYERLIGEGGVRVLQWDREVRADHMNYTRGFSAGTSDEENLRLSSETLKLEGSVLLSTKQGMSRSSSLMLDLLKQQAVLEGKTTAENGRIRLEVFPDSLVREKDVETSAAVPNQGRKMVLQAYRGSLDNLNRRVVFEGEVEMQRIPEDLYVRAGAIHLNFDKDQFLTHASARQAVCMEQPGRVAKAERALFDERKQTVLLEGDVEVESGQYNLKGSTINLYLDVSRGVAQGNDNAPIQMTIVMGGEFNPSFTCR